MQGFDFKIGFSCNNQCVHCVIGDRASWVPDLTTEQVLSTLDEKRAAGFTSVGFTGGEISIRKDLLTILRHAKNLGFYVAVQTNATGFADSEYAAQLAPYLDQALIAIHSIDKSVHNFIVGDSSTGNQTMFDRTMQGLYNMVALPNVYVQTQTVLSKLNLHTIYDTYDHIQRIAPGIRMNMTYPHPMGGAYTNGDVVLFQYYEAKEIFHRILRDFAPVLATEAIPYCYLFPYQDKIAHNTDAQIMTGIRDAGVDPAHALGYFDKPDDTLFDETGFIENYAFADLSSKVKGPLCRSCVFNKYCPGVWKEYHEFFKNSFDLFPITADQIDCSVEDILGPPYCQEDYQGEAVEETPQNLQSYSVILYTEGGCDSICAFCAGAGVEATNLELFISAKDQFDKHVQENENISIVEISGEGAANPYVVDLVSYIRTKIGPKGFIQLSTNGRALVNPELVSKLKKAGLSECRIPLYGIDREMHEKILRDQVDPTRDTFQEVIIALHNCAFEGIPIRGNIIVHQFNKEHLGAIIDLYYAVTDGQITQMVLANAGISRLAADYVGDWYLPAKDAGPYLLKVLDNPYFDNIPLLVFQYTYCTIGRYDDRIQAWLKPPKVIPDTINPAVRSEDYPGVPEYIVRDRFAECEHCTLREECSGLLRNDLKMFGSGNMRAIRDCD